MGAQRPQGSGVWEVKTAAPHLQGSRPVQGTSGSVCLQLYSQHSCSKKQRYSFPIFLGRILRPQEGMASLRAHSRLN